jgi:O-antigen/teichoic acid export membrane protein
MTSTAGAAGGDSGAGSIGPWRAAGWGTGVDETGVGDTGAGEGGAPGVGGPRWASGRLRGLARRFSWGLADQAVSSLTNFAVSLYVARTLGAAQFGAFALAYVTYSLVLNASRGLATDPLLVRFSATATDRWKRAVADCTGTAAAVGLAAGAAMLAAAALLSGTARAAFVAMGLTMPGLMLQDSWRYAFFAHGRGGQAFANDTIWALALAPALLTLRLTGHQSVFWFVLAWGAAATVAAAAGPAQARTLPRITRARAWITTHHDLAFRYLAENTTFSGSAQIRLTCVGVIAGLAAVGYVQAAQLVMGPFLAALMGVSLVTVPEAARVLRDSPRHLRLFCVLVAVGIAAAAAAWGVAAHLVLPLGLGRLALRSLWRPANRLLLPVTVAVMGTCVTVGASAGLRALGSSRRSLRAMVISSTAVLIASVIGALTAGALGTVRGMAVAGVFAAVVWWWQLYVALRESRTVQAALKKVTVAKAAPNELDQPAGGDHSQVSLGPWSRASQLAGRLTGSASPPGRGCLVAASPSLSARPDGRPHASAAE